MSCVPPGGPGEYEVVQCGSAGHNIRSQPNMNGAPVGRLTLKDTFTAMEEVANILQHLKIRQNI